MHDVGQIYTVETFCQKKSKGGSPMVTYKRTWLTPIQ